MYDYKTCLELSVMDIFLNAYTHTVSFTVPVYYVHLRIVLMVPTPNNVQRFYCMIGARCK